jgi:hypothetical protein
VSAAHGLIWGAGAEAMAAVELKQSEPATSTATKPLDRELISDLHAPGACPRNDRKPFGSTLVANTPFIDRL